MPINYNYLTARPFALKSGDEKAFSELALQWFRLQYEHNEVYKLFCKSLSVDPSAVRSLQQIPFLPIEAFKTNRIVTSLTPQPAETSFTSSGTTGSIVSKHYVNDLSLYEKSFLTAFQQFYGDPSQYCVLALLPSYLERSGSSLVYMAERLIKESTHPKSGFYLSNYEELANTIRVLNETKQKTLLLGVSYALLDLAETGVKLEKNFIVMETGGMKGRREEMLKDELHQTLKTKLGAAQIHSEYGMTELLSQAYSNENGLFTAPPWMKILVRDTNDPFSFLPPGRTGGINVIDLANLNSCSFIATQDLGKKHPDESFELMGRFDNSDIRGCNLLVE
jgi:phenylacetate-coenzyme A ligase PaaK-like adenylate-forming protein